MHCSEQSIELFDRYFVILCSSICAGTAACRVAGTRAVSRATAVSAITRRRSLEGPQEGLTRTATAVRS